MKNNLLLYSLFVCICIMAMPSVYAQEDTLRPNDVIIVKEFEPTLSDAFKIGTQPKTKDSIPPVITETNFGFYDKKIAVEYSPEPIKAAKMKGEPLSQLYRAYAKAGGGNYGTFLGDVYINNLRSKTANYGFHYHHLSSQGNVSNVANSAFSDNRLDVYGKRVFYNKILSGNLNYERNLVNYYGFNPDTLTDLENEIANDELEQIYQNFSGEIRFKSFFKDSDLVNFDFLLKARLFQNNFQATENNVDLDFTLDRFYNQWFTRIKGGVDFNQYDSPVNGFDNTLIHLSPTVSSGTDKWSLEIGIQALASLDSVTTYHVFPKLYAKYNVVGNLIIPYINIDGGVDRNNLFNLSRTNPFIELDPQLSNQITRYRAAIGVKGQFSSRISFDVSAQRKLVTNLPLFVNNYNNFLPNRFLPIYDEAVVDELAASLSYKHDDKLDIQLSAQVFQYEIKNELEAWHLPEFRASLFGFYQLNHKILARAEIFFVGQRFAKTFNAFEGESRNFGVFARELIPFVDANLGLEYRYTKKLSFFLDANNLGSVTYENWNYFPTQRFSILGGLTYSFWGR